MKHEMTKTISLSLNLIGLFFITVGSIGAALGAPAPQYKADGSVSLSNITENDTRIAMHRRQKWFPHFLKLVALGASLQAIALLL